MNNAFCLRAATVEDSEFIFASYKTTLRQYVEWAWGWDEDFQSSGFWKHHPLMEFQVVMVGGTRAGAIHVQKQESLNFIRMVFLLPEFQGAGIGSQLLRAEVARAHELARQLELKVIKINPAKRLYERLGFTVIGEDNVSFHMRAAQQVAPADGYATR
jgi:ribosomal protein S18 acetylase RimI-like enzyme